MFIRLMLCSSLLTVPVTFGTAAGSVPPGQTEECGTWEDCRDRALAAKEAGDFESLHDLAWRAVQKGPRNDASLMTLVARAQSLSGRPGDALVMLQRLAAMGVVTDAAESEDFRRVRALPGWGDLQARIAETAAAGEPDAAGRSSAKPSSRKPSSGGTEAKEDPVPKTASRSEGAKAAPGPEVDDALRFTTIPFEPSGLAYDAVSNRFIIGDRGDRKLNVIGERSQRIATLAGEESAGFGQVEALAIDPREGDLWVASTPDGAPPKLHKLQLISGRSLYTATIADDGGDARFTDIAVDRNGVVFALDSSGRRLFALKPGTRQIEIVKTELPAGVALALAPGGAIYVAGPEGLARLDSGEKPVPVEPSNGIDLANLACVRWHRGSLVAVQRSADGRFSIVRIRLDNDGRRASRIDVLEKNVSMAGPSIAVSGDDLFYLGRSSGYTATGGMDVTIRRLTLR
jgi:hypothetical protein